MESIFSLILDCLLLDALILAIGYISIRFVRPRWPEWWEKWIAAPHPDEFELDEDFPII
jgi:hypothetical protein